MATNNVLIQRYQGATSGYQELNPIFIDEEINTRLGLPFGFNFKNWIDFYSQFWWKKRKREVQWEKVATEKKVSDYTSTSNYADANYIVYIYYNTVNYVVRYADSININQDTGKIELVSPSSITLTKNSTSRDISGLVGKYVTYLNPDGKEIGIAYIPENATAKYYYSPSYKYFFVDSIIYISTREKIILGNWEYLQSKKDDTYLKNGIQNNIEYQFLGNPLKDFQNQTKIDCGSYIGTGGTPSEISPIRLTFNFVPKFIFIAPDEFQKYGDSNVWSNYYNCIFWTPRITKVQFFNYNTDSFRYFDLDGLTFSFYDVVGDGSYPTLNSYGVNYNYVACG